MANGVWIWACKLLQIMFLIRGDILLEGRRRSGKEKNGENSGPLMLLPVGRMHGDQLQHRLMPKSRYKYSILFTTMPLDTPQRPSGQPPDTLRHPVGGHGAPKQSAPRQCAPRQSAPETMCPGDNMPQDNLPRRLSAPETTCPGDNLPRETTCLETTCPGDYMPRDNVPRRHHAPETIRPDFKIHYRYSTMLG